jgi:hypothetical protein
VEHHLESLAFPLRGSICRLFREELLFFLNSLPYDGSYSDAQALCLLPAAVGQGRVVRGRRREMPLLVGSVKSISVSVKVSEVRPLHHGPGWQSWLTSPRKGTPEGAPLLLFSSRIRFTCTKDRKEKERAPLCSCLEGERCFEATSHKEVGPRSGTRVEQTRVGVWRSKTKSGGQEI